MKADYNYKLGLFQHKLKLRRGLRKRSTFRENDTPESRNTQNKRIRKEIERLENNVFLADDVPMSIIVDEENIRFWRIVLYGPDGTPYEMGVFVFDIYIPVRYPLQSPLIRLISKRKKCDNLHPYIFLSGFIDHRFFGCDDLWNPALSLHKFLLSFHSIFFTEFPILSIANDPEEVPSIDDNALMEYNTKVRKSVVKYFIHDMIRSPPFGVEDPLQIHFKSKRVGILIYLDAWFPESGGQEDISDQPQESSGIIQSNWQRLRSYMSITNEHPSDKTDSNQTTDNAFQNGDYNLEMREYLNNAPTYKYIFYYLYYSTQNMWNRLKLLAGFPLKTETKQFSSLLTELREMISNL